MKMMKKLISSIAIVYEFVLQVGVNDDGKIQYLTASVIQDDGCSHNENILSYTIGGFPNCYDSDYFDVKSAAVLTDLPSNTFARAPGIPLILIVSKTLRFNVTIANPSLKFYAWL